MKKAAQRYTKRSISVSHPNARGTDFPSKAVECYVVACVGMIESIDRVSQVPRSA